jgi:hypothetical protein
VDTVHATKDSARYKDGDLRGPEVDTAPATRWGYFSRNQAAENNIIKCYTVYCILWISLDSG